MEQVILRRAGIASGLAAPLAFSVLYVYAVLNDPGYVFFEDYLSDLGVGSAAWAFNLSVMSAGVLIVLFAALGLWNISDKGWLDIATTVLLSIAGTMLFCIGVFTEDAGDVHLFFSLAFFLVLLVFLGAFVAVLNRSKILGMPGTIFTAAVFVFGLVLVLMGANPQTETLAVMAALGWSAVVCAALLVKEYRT